MDYLELAPLFKDHMVIQRDKQIIVWGQGPENAVVEVIFDKVKTSCVIKNHRWQCLLPPHGPAEGLLMTVKTDIPGFPEKVIRDIAVGDVWIAAGQSNMEYFLRYDAQWDTIQKTEKNSKIRMFNVPRLAFEGQQKDISDSGYWFFEGDSAWETFSAPGYCFAKALQPVIHVPVGIIGCNWGGTPAGAWIEESYLKETPYNIILEEYAREMAGKDMDSLRHEAMEAFAFEDSPKHQDEWKPMMYGLDERQQKLWMEEHCNDPFIPLGPWHQNRPSGLFHQMVEKVAPFSAKGVLWYQGESDEHHAPLYDKILERMIECWRDTWHDHLPFLIVQLAPFGRWLACTGENYPEVRRRQEMVSENVSDVYMTSVMDLGMYEDIHPKHKKEVGERLSLLARGCVYEEDIVCRPPKCISCEAKNQTILLKFDRAGDGLLLTSDQVNGLKMIVNHEDLKVLSAKAEGDCLSITVDRQVNGLCTVSFAEMDYVEVNLFNSAGLPAMPFYREFKISDRENG